MSYEKRDNTGILFPNDRKEKDSHPDFTGNATINGVDMWISAWKKTGAKGPFLSFAFKVKDSAAPRGKQSGGFDGFDKRPMSAQIDDELPPF